MPTNSFHIVKDAIIMPSENLPPKNELNKQTNKLTDEDILNIKLTELRLIKETVKKKLDEINSYWDSRNKPKSKPKRIVVDRHE